MLLTHIKFFIGRVSQDCGPCSREPPYYSFGKVTTKKANSFFAVRFMLNKPYGNLPYPPGNPRQSVVASSSREPLVVRHPARSQHEKNGQLFAVRFTLNKPYGNLPYPSGTPRQSVVASSSREPLVVRHPARSPRKKRTAFLLSALRGEERRHM